MTNVSKLVIHKQIYRRGPFGGSINTTLCGRQRRDLDDMNVGRKITCKFCLARMRQTRLKVVAWKKAARMGERETGNGT